MNPKTSRKYTLEVHRVLSPHVKCLQKLIFEPENCSLSEYPTRKYQQSSKSSIVPFTGGLRYGLRSESVNWMFNSIPGLKDRADYTWITDGPLQDALLLWIAHRDREEFIRLTECPRSGKKRESFIREQAFERLNRFTGLTEDGHLEPQAEDVDKQALTLLEDAMFLPEVNQGLAGEQQWGLDVGIHKTTGIHMLISRMLKGMFIMSGRTSKWAKNTQAIVTHLHGRKRSGEMLITLHKSVQEISRDQGGRLQ
ncbi:hypothetical protein V5O48_017422 [Marasmius crinis-equi]|uniref:Uncharacterized protein n=1 Tax=Marasmius crinis-equi TaxID=585013 RepID=A0ABR3ENZ8_9AGAR